MKCVVQRVREASVVVDGQVVAAAGPSGGASVGPAACRGLLGLVGVEVGDTESDRRWMADKVTNLRVFEDDAGKMNLSVLQVSGWVILVPNFTVAGDCRKGRRPSFDAAMHPPAARAMFEALAADLRALGLSGPGAVQIGVFGADMKVHLVNDGPVTLVLDSRAGGTPRPAGG